MPWTNKNLVTPKVGAKQELLFNQPASRVTIRFEKSPIFQKVAQKVSKATKSQNFYNKAQLESPKHLHQTTFET